MNHLARRGVDVITESTKHVHVSGHGSEEELKLVLALVRPRYFIPIHGEFRQLARHARVAELVTSGLPTPVEVITAENGDVAALRRRGRRAWSTRRPPAACSSTARASARSDDEVLRDRRHLAADGLVVPVVAVNRQTGAVEGMPEAHRPRLRHRRRGRACSRKARGFLPTVIAEASVEERTDSGLIKRRSAASCAAS